MGQLAGYDDYTLQKSSPAIDAGDPDLDGDGSTWLTDNDDQDPDSTRMDIGAFYYSQDDGPPQAPSGITLFPGNNQNLITWSPNEDYDLNSYNLYFGTSPTQHALLATIPKGVESYTHSDLINGNPYYYVLKAMDDFDNLSTASIEKASIPYDYKENFSLEMNGSDYFNLVDDLSFTTPRLSIMTWVKSSWEGSNGELIFELADYNANAKTNYYIYQLYNRDNKWEFYSGGSLANYGESIKVIDNTKSDEWLQIVITLSLDANEQLERKIYVNGLLAAKKDDNANKSNFYLGQISGNKILGNGNNYSSGGGVRGNIDEFAIWSDTLSQEAISLLYNKGASRDARINIASYNSANKLIQYYQFNEGASNKSYNLDGTPLALQYGTLEKNTKWSQEISTEDTSPPIIPIAFEAVSGDSIITLTWQANTEDDLDLYKIYTSKDSSNLTLLATIAKSETSYKHQSLDNDSIFYYTISAIDLLGNESDKSPIVYGIPFLLETLEPSGQGTSADPFLISHINHLYWISQNSTYWTQSKTGSNAPPYFKQVNDIDAVNTQYWDNGKGFFPIGGLDKDGNNYLFRGFYNGNNKKIENLSINRPTRDNVGLFGYVSGYDNSNDNVSRITNLGLENVNIIGNNYVGGLMGQTGGHVINTYVKGKVVGNNYVGGLIGSGYGNINNSYSQAAVTGNSNVGGFIGQVNNNDVKYYF